MEFQKKFMNGHSFGDDEKMKKILNNATADNYLSYCKGNINIQNHTNGKLSRY